MKTAKRAHRDTLLWLLVGVGTSAAADVVGVHSLFEDGIGVEDAEGSPPLMNCEDQWQKMMMSHLPQRPAAAAHLVDAGEACAVICRFNVDRYGSTR